MWRPRSKSQAELLVLVIAKISETFSLKQKCAVACVRPVHCCTVTRRLRHWKSGTMWCSAVALLYGVLEGLVLCGRQSHGRMPGERKRHV